MRFRWRDSGMLSLLLIPTLVLASVVKQVEHPRWTDKYDRYFKKYTKHYFGAGFDWRWFKAQGIAESGLRPKVRSKAGARGLMQIIPSTFKEIQQKNPHFVNIDDPHWNIAAAIYYDRQLYRRWQKRLPPAERISFAFASYNAGYSKMLRAFGKAGKPRSAKAWQKVEPFAPGETRHYVRRIHGLMRVE